MNAFAIHPPIDEMKRTFRDLDQLEQDLKSEIQVEERALNMHRQSLESVRNQKAAIGRTIALTP